MDRTIFRINNTVKKQRVDEIIFVGEAYGILDIYIEKLIGIIGTIDLPIIKMAKDKTTIEEQDWNKEALIILCGNWFRGPCAREVLNNIQGGQVITLGEIPQKR